MMASWERGRPARTKPGPASPISPTWINRERRHAPPSAWPMRFLPTGWLPAASHSSSAATKGTGCGRDARAPRAITPPLRGSRRSRAARRRLMRVGGGRRATSQWGGKPGPRHIRRAGWTPGESFHLSGALPLLRPGPCGSRRQGGRLQAAPVCLRAGRPPPATGQIHREGRCTLCWNADSGRCGFEDVREHKPAVSGKNPVHPVHRCESKIYPCLTMNRIQPPGAGGSESETGFVSGKSPPHPGWRIIRE